MKRVKRFTPEILYNDISKLKFNHEILNYLDSSEKEIIEKIHHHHQYYIVMMMITKIILS